MYHAARRSTGELLRPEYLRRLKEQQKNQGSFYEGHTRMRVWSSSKTYTTQQKTKTILQGTSKFERERNLHSTRWDVWNRKGVIDLRTNTHFKPKGTIIAGMQRLLEMDENGIPLEHCLQIGNFHFNACLKNKCSGQDMSDSHYTGEAETGKHDLETWSSREPHEVAISQAG